jgi:hypothetical protein
MGQAEKKGRKREPRHQEEQRSSTGASQPSAAGPAPDYQALFKELVRRSNGGDREALARLRRFLDQKPAIWQKVGDLTAHAEKAWMDLIAGRDQLQAESYRRKLAQLKGELAGPRPTPLEALLVDQVAVCWLGAQYAELQAAGPATGSLEQAAFKLRRAESGQKRLLNAAKTLATLRALLPEGLVPVNPVQLHEPPRKLA